MNGRIWTEATALAAGVLYVRQHQHYPCAEELPGNRELPSMRSLRKIWPSLMAYYEAVAAAVPGLPPPPGDRRVKPRQDKPVQCGVPGAQGIWQEQATQRQAALSGRYDRTLGLADLESWLGPPVGLPRAARAHEEPRYGEGSVQTREAARGSATVVQIRRFHG